MSKKLTKYVHKSETTVIRKFLEIPFFFYLWKTHGDWRKTLLFIIPKNKTLGKVGNEQHGERLLPRIIVISDEKARPIIFQPFRPIYKLTRILETNRPIRETPRHSPIVEHIPNASISFDPPLVRLQKLSHFTSRGTVPHRITSSFLPRSQRDQTERLEFRSCLENLRDGRRERGEREEFFVAFIRGKNGMTSGFEGLRKLPWYHQ